MTPPPGGTAATAAPGCKAPASTLQRDDVAKALGVSHFELGRLLREHIAPLPVRFDGVIFWYADELEKARGDCLRAVERWRQRRARNFGSQGPARDVPAMEQSEEAQS